MSSVQIERKSYEMPPREGISIAHFLTVADIERSARCYEKVFGARILSLGDGNAPGYLQLANIWMILNVGGGPTPDKPTVTLSVPDPNHINSFLNFRVADIQVCYELWVSRTVDAPPGKAFASLHDGGCVGRGAAGAWESPSRRVYCTDHCWLGEVVHVAMIRVAWSCAVPPATSRHLPPMPTI
jgi:hypothetical protein